MSGSKSSAPAAIAALPEAIALTVHSLPDPRTLQAQQRTRAGRLRMLLVVLACAAPVLASYFTFYVLKPQGRAYAELIAPVVEVPAALALRDSEGRAVPAESLKGQWLLTLVQEGACDSACERRLYAQRQLQLMLGKERDKFDKLLLQAAEAPPLPEKLSQALAQGGVTVLRAPRAQLQAWLKPAAGQVSEQHFYVIDPRGRWMMRAPADAEPQKFKRDLERLLRAASSWDQPGR